MKCVHVLMSILGNGDVSVTVAADDVFAVAKSAAAGISFMHWREFQLYCLGSNVDQILIGCISMNRINQGDAVNLSQGAVNALTQAGFMEICSGKLLVDLKAVEKASVDGHSQMMRYFSSLLQKEAAKLN